MLCVVLSMLNVCVLCLVWVVQLLEGVSLMPSLLSLEFEAKQWHRNRFSFILMLIYGKPHLFFRCSFLMVSITSFVLMSTSHTRHLTKSAFFCLQVDIFS